MRFWRSTASSCGPAAEPRPRDAGGRWRRPGAERGRHLRSADHALDENGQGEPYAAFGWGAHLAIVEVDCELGRTRVLRLVAAHDVGRAVNPTLIEGQVEGGSAQGIGFALMEEFVPGRTENLHDYLIPTAGDMPEVRTDPAGGAGRARAVRRQGHRRAGADPHRAGHPQRHPRRHRRWCATCR
jgi:CO/xanthine dehydrogenase Mo-binding subunit